MVLALAYEVPHPGCRDEYLARHYPPLSVAARYEGLGDNALQRVRELGPDLELLVGREDVDDRGLSVCGASCVCKRTEDQVAGLSRGHRERDGLEVPHLTDQDHVRVLPQDLPEGPGEAPAYPGRPRAG